MVAFLSEEWIEALDAAASGDGALAERTAELDLVVDHEVTSTPFGDVRYHVVLRHGVVRVHGGASEGDAAATIRFSQDYRTAASIALGTGSAQRAFMTGRLRVGGDLRALLEHAGAFEQVHDVFASVRAELDADEADRSGGTSAADA